jgi:protein-disulfide isomerase
MCDVCSEAITNPICPVCLSRGVDAWLKRYPGLKTKILPKLKKHFRDIEKRTLDSTQCIRCNDYRTSVCPYCFTERVLTELKNSGADKSVLSEFFEFFNFDMEHTGYSKEAEMLGVI